MLLHCLLLSVNTRTSSKATPVPCAASEFMCDNGFCVSYVALCEGTDSCGDGSGRKANCKNVIPFKMCFFFYMLIY